MEKTIRVLKIEPGKAPYEKEIPNTLEAKQKEVEGYIEVVDLGDGCLAVVNEEGKLNGMKPNRRVGSDIICGPFIICGDDDMGDFASLTQEQMDLCLKEFAEIPVFTGKEPELKPRMMFITF